MVVLFVKCKPTILLHMVDSILMRSKKMNELLCRAAKQQEQGEPAGKDNMHYAL
jgi:hypothetical protein